MTLSPISLLKEISNIHPNMWNYIKSFRAGKGKDLPNWPDWCYMPLAAALSIISEGDDNYYKNNFHVIKDNYLYNPAVLTAASTWRVSKGIYRFNRELYNSLVVQDFTGNLPCDVLKRVPEWCVYIETYSDIKIFDFIVNGFFAHLEYDVNTGEEELRFVFLHDSGCIAIPIHLGNYDLAESLKLATVVSTTQAKIYGLAIEPLEVNPSIKIEPFLNLVLYLCAENIDIPVQPKHPRYRVRMSGQVDVPKEPRVWSIGERIGAAFTKYREMEGQGRDASIESPCDTVSLRNSPRPHIRKSHWHHYWTGPREGRADERKLILKWLPPIPVGINEDDDNFSDPQVIHKVD